MAPPNGVITIVEPTPIVYYSGEMYAPLIEALHQWEASKNDTLVNTREQAYGGLQIRQCRLDHYNALNGTNYVLTDCFDYELSKKIFLYFTNHDSNGNKIPDKSWEKAAKDWNGSGPMTIAYWEKVKKIL
jgi:hypothetical protein